MKPAEKSRFKVRKSRLTFDDEEDKNNLSKNERKKLITNSTMKLDLLKLENFEFLKIDKRPHLIGTGTFCEVVLAKNKQNSNFYAIKKVDKNKLSDIDGNKDLIVNEIEIHNSLSHKNIVKFYNNFEDSNYFYLILEYVEGGTLQNRISTGIDEKSACDYFTQIVGAVSYLHSMNIIHRDIKPENILIVSQTGVAKLCDFGWSVRAGEGSRQTFCGTYEYMAPEIISETPYKFAVDAWSLGVLLYEMLHGYSPFINSEDCLSEDYEEIFKNIFLGKFACKYSLSDDAKDLIQQLLNVDDQSRMRVDDISKHSWVIKNSTGFILKDKNESKILLDPLTDFEEDLNNRETIQSIYSKKSSSEIINLDLSDHEKMIKNSITSNSNSSLKNNKLSINSKKSSSKYSIRLSTGLNKEEFMNKNVFNNEEENLFDKVLNKISNKTKSIKLSYNYISNQSSKMVKKIKQPPNSDMKYNIFSKKDCKQKSNKVECNSESDNYEFLTTATQIRETDHYNSNKSSLNMSSLFALERANNKKSGKQENNKSMWDSLLDPFRCEYK